MSYRSVMLLVGSMPLLIAAASYLAGEQIEVVVLRTVDGQGHAHDTRLWIVDHEGRPWVRGVRPIHRWVERIRANPRVELVRGDTTGVYTASVIDSDGAKRAIDDAMAAKYGWVDHWYELVVRNETIPIRLDPDGALPAR